MRHSTPAVRQGGAQRADRAITKKIERALLTPQDRTNRTDEENAVLAGATDETGDWRPASLWGIARWGIDSWG